MKKYLDIGSLILILLAMTVSAFATPIPGSINELVNGDFQTGNTGPWEVGAGLELDIYGSANNYGIYCMNPDPNNPNALLLRQVVDETLNPLWNWSMDQKRIDLMADIRCVWVSGDPGHPASSISFRLDWWGPEWNSSSVAPTGAVLGYSDWVEYFFPTENGAWTTVNPFVQNSTVLHLANGTPFQPRWVSVEVLINQAPGEFVWVDNLNLTSECIPEPMSMILGFMGLGSVIGLRRFVKK